MKNIDLELETLADTLRQTNGSIDFDLKAFLAVDPSMPPKNVHHAPQPVMYPEEYDGQDRLNIACTQTALSSGEQKKLVNRWCDVLPTLSNVRYLWFGSKVSQAMLEAACVLPKLELLYVRWGALESLDPIAQVANLRTLYLGTTGVSNIDALGQLHELKNLHLANVKSVLNLEPLGRLANLDSLQFTGNESQNLTIPSFSSFSPLTTLTWLHMGGVRTRDQSLRPLAPLKNLTTLRLGNFFPVEEFAWLSGHLPNTDCQWLSPFVKFDKTVFPCKSCKKNWQVMTSGKGFRLLCPTCDAVKLARHVLKFNAARAEAAELNKNS
ncbi:MAG: hypothetical protein ACXWIN_04530 [Burkholderiaceae bacterium]